MILPILRSSIILTTVKSPRVDYYGVIPGQSTLGDLAQTYALFFYKSFYYKTR
ncbi:MAG: hypothetical protein MJA82_13535 [Clostridia bacterium]|nr:hypothetical protein [Clostridia bacterium]